MHVGSKEICADLEGFKSRENRFNVLTHTKKYVVDMLHKRLLNENIDKKLARLTAQSQQKAN